MSKSHEHLEDQVIEQLRKLNFGDSYTKQDKEFQRRHPAYFSERNFHRRSLNLEEYVDKNKHSYCHRNSGDVVSNFDRNNPAYCSERVQATKSPATSLILGSDGDFLLNRKSVDMSHNFQRRHPAYVSGKTKTGIKSLIDKIVGNRDRGEYSDTSSYSGCSTGSSAASFSYEASKRNNFPHQSVTNDIWWYYMFSMAFYWSLCVSQFFDVKRKDFWQMFIHHIATILLMCLSWIVNVFRVGTLVLVVHDSADIFLEAAKMAKYSGYQKVCDVIFAIFTLLWIVTRLGFFPFWIIRNTSIDAPKIVPMFPAYYIFNGLLCILLVLHIFWTYLIVKIAINSLNAGQMDGDIRSSSDDDYSEESNNSNSLVNQNHSKGE
ncbi:unnamed protein product [Ceutorhynchus assimilis]|uniref:TLC domain-containing protein n=1 Tax=Ceutorhynchus assimilis TaxID=467358 RepID=A0A9N9QLV2_9CUCU|nr:unnamed protein product [Ceutorhynchus assimilis]